MTEKLKPGQTEDPIDLKGLSLYCSGKEDLVQKLLASFVQVGPLYLKQLSDAVERGDNEEIQAICHKIRGAASIIRAELLLEIVEQIRQSSVDADLDRAKESLPGLEKAFSDVSDFIKRLGAIIPS